MSYSQIMANFHYSDSIPKIDNGYVRNQNYMYNIKKTMSINSFLEKAFNECYNNILTKPNVLFAKSFIKNLEFTVNGSMVDKTKKIKDYSREQQSGNNGWVDIDIRTRLACIKCTMLDKNILYCLVPSNSLFSDVLKLLKPFTKEKTFYDNNNKVITSTNKILDIAKIGDYYELKYNDTTPIFAKDSDEGYIYMIKTREFIKTKEEIYKIGKTERNVLSRASEYPKNSQLITCIPIPKNKLSDIENNLIKLFSMKFKQRTDIGTEYFEGERTQMIKEIITETLH